MRILVDGYGMGSSIHVSFVHFLQCSPVLIEYRHYPTLTGHVEIVPTAIQCHQIWIFSHRLSGDDPHRCHIYHHKGGVVRTVHESQALEFIEDKVLATLASRQRRTYDDLVGDRID